MKFGEIYSLGTVYKNRGIIFSDFHGCRELLRDNLFRADKIAYEITGKQRDVLYSKNLINPFVYFWKPSFNTIRKNSLVVSSFNKFIRPLAFASIFGNITILGLLPDKYLLNFAQREIEIFSGTVGYRSVGNEIYLSPYGYPNPIIFAFTIDIVKSVTQLITNIHMLRKQDYEKLRELALHSYAPLIHADKNKAYEIYKELVQILRKYYYKKNELDYELDDLIYIDHEDYIIENSPFTFLDGFQKLYKYINKHSLYSLKKFISKITVEQVTYRYPILSFLEENLYYSKGDEFFDMIRKIKVK